MNVAQRKRTRVALNLSALLLLVGMAGGCSCDEPAVVEVDGGAADAGCTTDEACQQAFGPLYTCCAGGECCPGPRYCDENGDLDCCPDQVCSARAGICVQGYDSCTDDASCKTKGQTCREMDVGGGTLQTVCTFDRCGADGACAEGLSCFAGWCVGENPCGGSCGAGQACSPANDRCHAGCELTCPAGSLATFDDPENIGEACDLENLTCACVPLPPLEARDVGRHSALAVLADGRARVSAFEGDHGDLVVVSFDASGARTGTVWVDGVPSGGTPVADPAGPRGGIAEPGPEVGRYTDIAAAPDGTLHVSYYDATDGALKYARGAGDAWTTEVVDDAGDVGRYTSIALDASGAPVIAYFQRSGEGADAAVSALKVARASSPTPTAATDWSVVTVDTGAITPPPCDGGCSRGKACVDVGSGPECRTVVSGCASCASGEQCVDTGAASACQAEIRPSSLDDLPEGVGLFPSLAVTADGLAVAYYDRNAGDLKLATGIDPAAGTPGTVQVLAGADADVGRFPSLAAAADGRLVVAYVDVTHDDLDYLVVGTGGAVEDQGVVDDGLRDPAGNGPSKVGADAALVLDGDRFVVAYQDATAGDLVLAVRGPDGTWAHRTLVSDGAAGFWADAALHDGEVFVSHAAIRAAKNGPLFTTLSVERTAP